MKEISLREEQLIELNILVEFAKFCDDHGLRYFLDSGTLIGAIRHQGFIPWDDDVDVCFLRADYTKFVELMNKQDNRLTEHIKLETEADSLYPYLKLVDTRTVLVEYPHTNPVETGIYIDIFPKDGLLSKDRGEVRRAKKVKRHLLVAWVGTFTFQRLARTGGLKNRIAAAAIKLLIPHPDKYKQKAIALAQKHNGENFSYVSSLVCSGMGGCAPIECFADRVTVSFEGHTFQAPAGYDQYLRYLYKGDYMVPPPPEKRVAHETVVYWKDGFGEDCL